MSFSGRERIISQEELRKSPLETLLNRKRSAPLMHTGKCKAPYLQAQLCWKFWEQCGFVGRAWGVGIHEVTLEPVRMVHVGFCRGVKSGFVVAMLSSNLDARLFNMKAGSFKDLHIGTAFSKKLVEYRRETSYLTQTE
jgi:hypothetical protein